MNKDTFAGARWLVALATSIVMAVVGWAYASAETIRNREQAKALVRVEEFDYLMASHTAQLAMVKERLDEIQELVVETNRLLLQYMNKD